MHIVRPHVRQGDARQIADPPGEGVGRGDAVADGHVELRELGHGNRTLQFIHPRIQGQKIVVGLRVAIAPRFVDEEAHAAGQRVVAGDHQPAFTGGDMLALLQAVTADRPQGAHQLSLATGQISLGAVLNHGHVMPLGQGHNRRHVTRIAKQVRHNNGLGPVAQTGRDGLSGDVRGAGIDIGKHRDSALIQNWGNRAHICDRRGDDLIARLGIDRGYRGMNGARAG